MYTYFGSSSYVLNVLCTEAFNEHYPLKSVGNRNNYTDVVSIAVHGCGQK
jgi:hypothetical protein